MDTNLNSPDTDKDGINDYDEMLGNYISTNPKNPDTDGDGINDLDEKITRGP
jgi:hypothetical protein